VIAGLEVGCVKRKNNSRPSYFGARIQEINQMISLGFIQGNITYDELSLLEDSAIEDQVHNLKEDMLQVEYPDGFLLDVGWFPSFDAKGHFQIKVVKDYDWDSPTLTLTTQSIDTLGKLLLRAQSQLIQH
jgi:hypothetical protein